jgi:hypothetical protein
MRAFTQYGYQGQFARKDGKQEGWETGWLREYDPVIIM